MQPNRFKLTLQVVINVGFKENTSARIYYVSFQYYVALLLVLYHTSPGPQPKAVLCLSGTHCHIFWFYGYKRDECTRMLKGRKNIHWLRKYFIYQHNF